MLRPTPTDVSARPASQVAGTFGNQRQSSQPQCSRRPKSSQNPRTTGRACCSISEGVSSFLARFMPTQSSTQTTRSALQSHPAHSEALSTVRLNGITILLRGSAKTCPSVVDACGRSPERGNEPVDEENNPGKSREIER